MSNPETVLPSDQVEGAPHPRETQKLVGQERAEQQFLEVFETGRLHHSWMISGPRGIGKATLAWTLARFLLATSPTWAVLAVLLARKPARRRPA